jgi:UTP--glucose-1-phosphate uridylyltransferase
VSGPSLTKAVIPAAGLGTRMLPAARAVPKELLPVLDRPTVQYVVEEAAAAGLTDVLLVSSAGKPALAEHFRSDPELTARLTAGGKAGLMRSLDELLGKIRISTVHQPSPRGLGDAVAQAREFVGNEAFVCLLGDTIFGDTIFGPGLGPASELAAAYARLGTSVIGLAEVAEDRVSRYGIVGGDVGPDGVVRITTLVEKPSPAEAPSRLAIAARYVLTPGIFDCLDQVAPGKNGEVQLTDAIRLLCDREPVHGIVLKSPRHDVGNPVDWLRTNLIFAAADQQLWAQIEPTVRGLLNRGA